MRVSTMRSGSLGADDSSITPAGRRMAAGSAAANTAAERLPLLLDPDLQLAELLGRHVGGAAIHEARGTSALRERNRLADARAVAEQHDDAVEAQPDAAVRRRGKLIGLEQEAELLVGLLVRKPDHLHHP